MEQRDHAFREVFRVRKALKNKIKILEQENSSLRSALTESTQTKMNQLLLTKLESTIQEKDVVQRKLKRVEDKKSKQRELLEMYSQQFKDLKATARTKLKEQKLKISRLRGRVKTLKTKLTYSDASHADYLLEERYAVAKGSLRTYVDPEKCRCHNSNETPQSGKTDKQDCKKDKGLDENVALLGICSNKPLQSSGLHKSIISAKLLHPNLDDKNRHRGDEIGVLVEKIISDDLELQDENEPSLKSMRNNQELDCIVPADDLKPFERTRKHEAKSRAELIEELSIVSKAIHGGQLSHASVGNEFSTNGMSAKDCIHDVQSLQPAAQNNEKKGSQLKPELALNSKGYLSNGAEYEKGKDRRQFERLAKLEERECEHENKILTTDLINARLEVAQLREENIQLRNVVCKLKIGNFRI